ncbi:MULTISPECIES: porin [unclassified Yoonia]|uniref:porin n=1 Tax=unclassified Yoonia TaxID=2629118 RepID=UPI002AFE5F10|nr:MULTISPECIES: porin [unclassified Yoonia]
MKSILLTTTALVAFAGAAAAEGHNGVSFKGTATLGYNDSDPAVEDQGFYWDGHLDVKLSQELDNGVTAGVTVDFDFADNNLGENLFATDYVLSLTTADAGLFFGDIKFAAETQWTAAGTMTADNFSEADGETALRGDLTYGGIDMSLSVVIANNAEFIVEDDTGDAYTQLSVGASGDLGAFSFSVAYQEENEFTGYFSADGLGQGDNGDFNDSEVFGVSVGTTFAGATVRLAYADNSATNSTGVSVSYPVGPVTVSGYFVAEDAGDDSYGVKAVYADGPISLTANYEDRTGSYRYNVEGSYDIGNGLVAKAGYLDRESWTGEAFYVAGEYDLGGGASLLVSYADAEDADYADDDEIGADEFQFGTTVELSFKF